MSNVLREWGGLLLLGVLLGGVYLLSNQSSPKNDVEQTSVVFDFEKQDIQQIEILQPTTGFAFNQHDGIWTFTGTEMEMSQTMLNRIKHQLHHLELRSLVEDKQGALEDYGLGTLGTQVTLDLRTGEQVKFTVGGPNPTGVSYYVQVHSGPYQGEIVTVAKAAVDYFTSGQDEFRAEHMLKFDWKAVTDIEVNVFERFETPSGSVDYALPAQWRAERLSSTMSSDGSPTLTESWSGGLQPVEDALSLDFIRRLTGRLLALKAVRYVGQMEIANIENADTIRAKIVLQGEGVDVEVLVGPNVASGQTLIQVKGLEDAVIVRDGFLDELLFDPVQTRQRALIQTALSDLGRGSLKMHGEKPLLILIEDGVWTAGIEQVPVDVQRLFTDFQVREWIEPDSVSWMDFLTLQNEQGVERFNLQLGILEERNVALPDEPPLLVSYRMVKIRRIQQVGISAEQYKPIEEAGWIEEAWVQQILDWNGSIESVE